WVIDEDPLGEGDGWQDWPAFHRVATTDRARIRFLVSPPGASATARAKIRQVAEHEYRVMSRLPNSRLHGFWLETATQSVNTLSNGSSGFYGYRHDGTAHFAVRRPDGRWSPPQPLTVLESPARPRKSLLDPVITVIGAINQDDLGANTPGDTATHTPDL